MLVLFSRNFALMLCIRDGEPLTRGSLSDPLTDFSDPLVVSKTVGKNRNEHFLEMKKSLSAYAVALKTFYLLFTPNSLFAESWEFMR